MIVRAIQCDSEGCFQVVNEDTKTGWLTVGGERRGRRRIDLCPFHAHRILERLMAETRQRSKKKA